MSFILETERPDVVKFGYGYIKCFEDGEYYIGSTSKPDDGQYHHSKKTEDFLKKVNKVPSETKIMYFGKSPNDPWYWEGEQLYKVSQMNDGKGDPKCLNDKLSGGGPLYHVHGRTHLLDEGYGKIVKDSSWNEDTQLWENPFFEVGLDTIDNLYTTYRMPRNTEPMIRYYQSRFFDIIESHRLNLVDDIDEDVVNRDGKSTRGNMRTWKPVVLLMDYFGKGEHCLFDKNHTVVSGYDSESGKFSDICVLYIPKSYWKKFTKDELDFLSKRLNRPVEFSSLRTPQEDVEEFYLNNFLDMISKKNFKSGDERAVMDSPSLADEVKTWGYSIREIKSIRNKVYKQWEEDEDIRKKTRPGYKFKQYSKTELQFGIDKEYKNPDGKDKDGNDKYSKKAQWKNKYSIAKYVSSKNFDHGDPQFAVYSEWPELKEWRDANELKKKEISKVIRHYTIKVHHPTPTAEENWDDEWKPFYKLLYKNMLDPTLPIQIHWDNFDAWIKVS